MLSYQWLFVLLYICIFYGMCGAHILIDHPLKATDWKFDVATVSSSGVIAALRNDIDSIGVMDGGANLHILETGDAGFVPTDLLSEDAFKQVRRRWEAAKHINNRLPSQDHKIIVSMSYTSKYGQAEATWFRKWSLEDNILFVAAAGNTPNRKGYYWPATYDGVISVATTNCEGMHDPDYLYNPKVEILAPGVDVFLDSSLNPRDYVLQQVKPSRTIQNTMGVHQFADGSSFSVPYVSGILAKVWSAFPNEKSARIRQATLLTARKLPPGYNTECQVVRETDSTGKPVPKWCEKYRMFGNGIINAQAMVDFLNGKSHTQIYADVLNKPIQWHLHVELSFVVDASLIE